jgi:hypothetical protein
MERRRRDRDLVATDEWLKCGQRSTEGVRHGMRSLWINKSGSSQVVAWIVTRASCMHRMSSSEPYPLTHSLTHSLTLTHLLTNVSDAQSKHHRRSNLLHSYFYYVFFTASGYVSYRRHSYWTSLVQPSTPVLAAASECDHQRSISKIVPQS